MGSVKSGRRNVPGDVELTDEFKYDNYRETIARMFDLGICKRETALEMLDRVEALVGEGSE